MFFSPSVPVGGACASPQTGSSRRDRPVFVSPWKYGLLVGAVLLAVACESDATSSEAVSRDSAGIAIREYPDVAAEGVASLRAIETVSIGAVEGDEHETFNRISDIAAGPDGRLHVLDGGDQVVDVYDPDGTWILRYGGKGEGPAEFQRASLLVPLGDSIAVYDYRTRKLALFDGDGSLRGTRRWELPLSRFGFLSMLAPVEGGFIGLFDTGCTMPPPEDRRPAWKLLALAPDGAVRDTVALLFPGDLLAIYGERFCTGIPALGGAGYDVAIREDGTAAFTAERTYEVLFFPLTADEDHDGTLPAPTRILRRQVEPKPVSSADVEEYRDRWLTVSEERRLDDDHVSAIRRAMDSTTVPVNYPEIDDLLWEDDDRLWVGRTLISDAADRRWDVYDGEGRLVAEAVLPANLDDVLVRDGMAWGTIRDELGVMYVKGYRLEDARPAADP